MIASHYVIQDISRAFDADDLELTKAIFDKFSSRYHKDMDLQKIYGEFQDYLAKKDTEKLQHITSRLRELQGIRKLETSGAQILQLKDRRHFTTRTKLEFEEY